MATIEEIKKLRDMTGAGVNAVREALAETNGDIEAALSYLRKKGMAKSDKRKEKTAANGVMGVYIHSNRQVVVVVEAAVETDFAAKSPDVIKFANDIALQVAASNPEFINVESIPEAALKVEKETYEKELEGKPENIKENILKGKLEKYFKDKVLVKQQLFIDDSKTVEDYISELVAKIGEKIVIKSFSKFQVSEPVSSCTINLD